jgi:hypothetical protein
METTSILKGWHSKLYDKKRKTYKSIKSFLERALSIKIAASSYSFSAMDSRNLKKLHYKNN